MKNATPDILENLSESWAPHRDRLNIPLFRKTVEWVEEQAALPLIDQRWRQSDWEAPPNLVASYLARGSLEERGLSIKERTLLEPHCGTTHCFAGKIVKDAMPEANMWDINVKREADELLGLDEYTISHSLYWGSNDAEDIRLMAEAICGEAL